MRSKRDDSRDALSETDNPYQAPAFLGSETRDERQEARNPIGGPASYGWMGAIGAVVICFGPTTLYLMALDSSGHTLPQEREMVLQLLFPVPFGAAIGAMVYRRQSRHLPVDPQATRARLRVALVAILVLTLAAFMFAEAFVSGSRRIPRDD